LSLILTPNGSEYVDGGFLIPSRICNLITKSLIWAIVDWIVADKVFELTLQLLIIRVSLADV